MLLKIIQVFSRSVMDYIIKRPKFSRNNKPSCKPRTFFKHDAIMSDFHITVRDIAYAITCVDIDQLIPVCIISMIIYFTGDRLTVLQLHKLMQFSGGYCINLIRVYSNCGCDLVGSTLKKEDILLTPNTQFWRAIDEDKQEGFERLHLYEPSHIKMNMYSEAHENCKTWDDRHRFQVNFYDNSI